MRDAVCNAVRQSIYLLLRFITFPYVFAKCNFDSVASSERKRHLRFRLSGFEVFQQFLSVFEGVNYFHGISRKLLLSDEKGRGNLTRSFQQRRKLFARYQLGQRTSTDRDGFHLDRFLL